MLSSDAVTPPDTVHDKQGSAKPAYKPLRRSARTNKVLTPETIRVTKHGISHEDGEARSSKRTRSSSQTSGAARHDKPARDSPGTDKRDDSSHDLSWTGSKPDVRDGRLRSVLDKITRRPDFLDQDEIFALVDLMELRYGELPFVAGQCLGPHHPGVPMADKNLDEYKAASTRAIFFNHGRVSDPTDSSVIAGLHWALGVEHDGRFSYYDSVRDGRDLRAAGALSAYNKLLSASGVSHVPKGNVRRVKEQPHGWECGLLAVEILRQITCEHGNDPSAVNTWGDDLSIVTEKWQRLIQSVLLDVDLSSSSDDPDDNPGSDSTDSEGDDSESDVDGDTDYRPDQDETGNYDPSDGDTADDDDDDNDSLYITDDEEYINKPCLVDEPEPECQSDLESDSDKAAEAKPKSTRRTLARTTKARRHVAKKFVPVPESFDDWLARINREYPVADADNDKDIKRFRANWRELVSRLDRIIKGYKGLSDSQKTEFKRSLHYSVTRFFHMKGPEDISDNHIAHTPLIAQKILGNPDLAPEDLLRLPEGVPELLLWGVYQIIPARYPLENIVNAPHPQYEFRLIDTVRSLRDGVDPLSAKEFMSYTGSAINNENGLRTRVHKHTLETNRDELKSDLAVHKYGNQKDIVCHYRITSAWDRDDDTDPRYPPSYEGMLMTYLGLQLYGTDGENHPMATFRLNRRLRLGLDLPDLSGFSLNRAWPLFQGFSKGGSTGTANRICANPGCGKKAPRFNGAPKDSGIDEAICNRCADWYRIHDSMWPIRKDGRLAQRTNADGTAMFKHPDGTIMTCQAEGHIHHPDPVKNNIVVNYRNTGVGVCHRCACLLTVHGWKVADGKLYGNWEPPKQRPGVCTNPACPGTAAVPKPSNWKKTGVFLCIICRIRQCKLIGGQVVNRQGQVLLPTPGFSPEP